MSEIGNLRNTWGKYGVLTACTRSIFNPARKRNLVTERSYNRRKLFLLKLIKHGSYRILSCSSDIKMKYVTMAQRNKLPKRVYLTHFPFGLGCSGVANGSLVYRVLLMEKPSLNPKFWTQIYKPCLFAFPKQMENVLVMACLDVLFSCFIVVTFNT